MTEVVTRVSRYTWKSHVIVNTGYTYRSGPQPVVPSGLRVVTSSGSTLSVTKHPDSEDGQYTKYRPYQEV